MRSLGIIAMERQSLSISTRPCHSVVERSEGLASCFTSRNGYLGEGSKEETEDDRVLPLLKLANRSGRSRRGESGGCPRCILVRKAKGQLNNVSTASISQSIRFFTDTIHLVVAI